MSSQNKFAAKVRGIIAASALSAADIRRPPPKLPAIQQVDSSPQSLARAVGQIKEIIETREGQRGSPLDQAVTWRDMHNAGLVRLIVDGTPYMQIPTGAVQPTTPPPDMTIPPAPTGLAAGGALANIILSWDAPNYSNHGYTEVWRSGSDNLGTAVLTGTTRANVYVDNVGSAATYYYWIRFRSTSDRVGPYNAQAGVRGETGKDPAYVLEVLLGKLGYDQFDLAAGVFPITTVTTLPTLPNAKYPVGVHVYLTTDGKLYRNKAGVWSAEVATSDLIGQIVAGQIADSAVTATKFAQGIEPVAVVDALPNPSGYTGPKTVLLTTDGKLYRYASGAWTAKVPTVDLTGQITETQVTDNAITTPKIKAGAVTADQIAASAVTAAKIAADAVVAGKIAAGAVSASQIAAGAVRAQHLLVAPKSLNLDPSFETGAAGWTGFVRRLPRADAAVPAGCPASHASEFNARDNMAAATLDVVEGETYRLSVWVNRGTGAGGAGVGGFGQVLDGAGSSLASFAWPGTTTTATGWVRVSGIYTIPAGGSRLRFGPWADRPTYTGEAWYADLTLEKLHDASLVVDGAITTVKLAAGAVSADKIAANAIVAGKIAAGAIVAGDGVISNAAIGTAHIIDGTITNAKIGNLAVDDTKIANLSAGKINAGDIAADRMQANIVTALVGKYAHLSALTSSLGTVEIGSTGFLRTAGATAYGTGLGIWMGYDSTAYKFRVGDPAAGGKGIFWDGASLTVRGALDGVTGTFSGDLSGASGIFKGGVRNGAYTGWAWPAAGENGFYLGPEGLLLGNANNGRYLQVTSDGNIYAPKFSIENGNATFSGALNAASGTFSGSLTAEVVNTDNIISNALTEADDFGTVYHGTSFAINRQSKVLIVATWNGNYTGNASQGYFDFGIQNVTTARQMVDVNITAGTISVSANLAAGTYYLHLQNGPNTSGYISKCFILKVKK